MAFNYFSIVKDATGLLPIHPLHDGCLWIEQGENFSHWIKKENYIHSFSFKSFVQKELFHQADIRWKNY
jgi:hypothetical protein